MTQTDYFSFEERNPGHWDIYAFTGPDKSKERAFRIRGGPHDVQWHGDGTYWISDERSTTEKARSAGTDQFRGIRFPDLPSTVAFITSLLMKAPNNA